MYRAIPMLVLAAALAAAGCQSDEDPDGGGGAGAGGTAGSGGSGGTGGTGGVGGTGGTGGTGGEEPPDGPDTGWTVEPPPTFHAPMTEVERPSWCGDEFAWWSSVRGFVVAPGGRYLPDVRASLCVDFVDAEGESGYVCLQPVRSNEEGVFTVEPPFQDRDMRCLKRAAMRVFAQRSGRATVYVDLELEGGPARLITEPIVLPRVTPALDLPPEGDPEAPREVRFDDGLTLEVVPAWLWPVSGGYEDLGARRIPTDAVGLSAESAAFDGLYAFAPESAVDEAPGFAVSIPNVHDWEPGSTVELFVLGGIDCRLFGHEELVPEGTWAKFGEATVSGDGETIVSNADNGLPCLTWMAYRLKE